MSYIKKLEDENKKLYELLKVSGWFCGTENITSKYITNFEKHDKWHIDAGWFWMKKNSPQIDREIENSMELYATDKPIMCKIYYSTEKKWRLSENGCNDHPLETFKNYWFAGPLNPPFLDHLYEHSAT